MPVPLKATPRGLPEALSTMFKVPERLAALAGWNRTLMLQVEFGARVPTQVLAEMVKALEPEIAVEEMIRFALPVFDRVTAWVTGEFTVTVPNEIADVFRLETGAGTG